MYFTCFISMCPNNSKRNPNKIFIRVPTEETRRKEWFKVARVSNNLSKYTKLYVCEDHFDLESDLANYESWILNGGPKLLTATAIPHKFDGLPNRNKLYCIGPPPIESNEITALIKERATLSEQSANLHNLSQEECSFHNLTEEDTLSYVCPQPSTSRNTSDDKENDQMNKKDIGITVKPSFRSKHVQATVETISKTCSPMKVLKNDATTSPKKCRNLLLKFQESPPTSFITESVVSSFTTESGTTKTATATTSTDESSNSRGEQIKTKAKEITLNKIILNPRRYLGIPKECFFVISLIKKYTFLDDVSIYLTLNKIRCARTFFELGDDFGMSESTASRIFAKAVVLISNLLKQFIISPSNQQTKALLPIPFRKQYNKVQFIIDCWEIEINKPTNAIHQALTWSEYKKCNTIKYLVSCTPDGIVNFISQGFGGRASDTIIVEECGFLDIITPGAVIMADRGFKHVERHLIAKGCQLLRPPSVATGEKLTKEQVLETKRIASLRIHVERLIRRLREFRLIKPHACIHSKLIGYLDHITIIACGLINLQDPLIK